MSDVRRSILMSTSAPRPPLRAVFEVHVNWLGARIGAMPVATKAPQRESVHRVRGARRRSQ